MHCKSCNKKIEVKIKGYDQRAIPIKDLECGCRKEILKNVKGSFWNKKIKIVG
jgi:hypothetical protein